MIVAILLRRYWIIYDDPFIAVSYDEILRKDMLVGKTNYCSSKYL